ncbi:MAG: hypothetical protein CME68_06035 [Halobacteriovoraceae bacterium]|nr:hypothetical protein [Halobacteriovoraceae bacterium]
MITENMKMKKLIFTLVFFSFLGCTDNYIYSPLNSHSFMIELPKGTIDRVKVIDWKVGRGKYLNKISKGILVSLNIPSISKKDLEDINKKTEVDSWLIRVSKISRTGNTTTLGHITLPLVQKNWRKSSNKKFFRDIKKTGFSIFYSAAAHSSRFEKFSCPAFDHNKIISDFSIEKRKTTPTKKVLVQKGSRYPLTSKSEEIGFFTRLNGGIDMKGSYTFELAFYNAKRSRRQGSFMPFREFIKIPDEKAVNIKSCAGFKPTPLTEENKFRQFRFKR